MSHLTLLLSLIVALLVVLGLSVESGRAAERIRLVIGTVVMCLGSAVALILSSSDGAALLAKASQAVERTSWPSLVGTFAKTQPSDAILRDVVLIKDCEACPKLIKISGGTFLMGLPDYLQMAPSEGPVRKVDVGPFALGRTEVTRGEFARFVAATGYEPRQGCETRTGFDPRANWRSPGFAQTDDHPVVCISQADALAYVAWIGTQSGKEFRLPTEAEWEFSVRRALEIDAASHSAERLGIGGPNVANPRGVTLPVGLLPPDRLGLVDMIGNAAELVADCWTPDLSGHPSDGSAARAGMGADCASGAQRGSSWRSATADSRPSKRARASVSSSTGFRVARGLAGSEMAAKAGQTASR